jgi:uncharacterized protein YprB with RNaseH-like and TPR domain
MDSLSDKLKALGIKLGARDIPQPVHREDYSIDKVVSGRYRSTIFGNVFCAENLYPGDYIHGKSAIKIHHPLDILAEWSHQDILASVDPDGFVFLDAETTGLAGGTGTYAFMVGAGRFHDGEFQLVQFFLRDPSEESAFLAALSEFVQPCQALVTFNGKAFDIPLLNTRYILQSISSPFEGTAHLDLLLLARRLWRDRLASRALGSLEINILGTARTQEEVPGWMIPQMYIDYINHNAMDILSLAALFNHTSYLLADPLSAAGVPGLDLVAMGKLYEDLGYRDHAIRLYERGINSGLPEEFYWKTIERFALLFKRERNWEQAIALWQKAAEHGDLHACIELAKYCEHEIQDIHAALSWTKAAINCLDANNAPIYLRKQLLPEIEHRMKRLETKLP